jgi:hypothetical protein
MQLRESVLDGKQRCLSGLGQTIILVGIQGREVNQPIPRPRQYEELLRNGGLTMGLARLKYRKSLIDPSSCFDEGDVS